QQFERHVLVDAAGPKIGRVHARARGTLVEVHAILAQLEQPQVRRHRADVHDVAAEVQHVILDAGQLGEDRKSTRLNSSHVAISYRPSFPTRRSSDLSNLSGTSWWTPPGRK